MSDLSDRLFIDLYDGPEFEKIPSLRNFRRRLMSAVQSAVSCGQPICVENQNASSQTEFLTLGGLNYDDIFMFNQDGGWLKTFHKVGDALYKIFPSQSLVNPSLNFDIPTHLGFQPNFANKLHVPSFAELAIYGMNVK